jgi:hypothetical protein
MNLNNKINMDKEMNFNPSGRTADEDAELDRLLAQDNLDDNEAQRVRELLNKPIDQAFAGKNGKPPRQPVVAITHDGRAKMIHSRRELKETIAQDKADRAEH